jgi:putative ABC transport system permease protein
LIPRAFFWNNLRLRPVRTMLTVLSVAGAVAAVIAVLQATAATRLQLNALTVQLSSRVAMEIVAKDTTPFFSDDMAELARDPDIEMVIPVFRVYTRVSAGEKQLRCLTLGVDSSQFQTLRDIRIHSGRLPQNPGEVALESRIASHLTVDTGDDVRLGARKFPWLVTKKVTGVYSLPTEDLLEETSAVLTLVNDAAKLGRSQKKVNALQIVLKEQADQKRAEGRVRQMLPSHLTITQSASASELSRPTEAMVSTGLNVAALLSVVAAVFIVINSFQMSVTERQRQLALMRILGATAGQIRSALYREAAVLGLTGTALGVIPGILGSSSLIHGMQEAIGFRNMISVPIQTHAIVAGLLFGPLVTLISVWYPARKLSAAAPLTILKPSLPERQSLKKNVHLILGILFFVTSGLSFFLTSQGILPSATSICGIAGVEIGGALLLPFLIAPCTRLYYRIVGRFFPVEATLGRGQLLDQFERTALTIAVMFVVSATSISVGNTTLSVTENIESWMRRTVAVDFILMASRPTVDMLDAKSLPQELVERINELPGVTMVDEATFCLASVNGRAANLAIQHFGKFPSLPIDLMHGDRSRLADDLQEGKVLLGSVLANLLQVHPGNTVHLEVSGVIHSLTVAGIIREYTAGGLMAQMDANTAEKLFPLPEPQVYGVKVEPSALTVTGGKLKELAREYGLIFQSLADLQEMIQGMISGITNRLFLILVLALVIAAFAIVNSLTMTVIEQTRYLGMLRVVGMVRRQAFRMFLFQSLILGILGIVPGILTGILMSWLTTFTFRGVTDHGIGFAVDSRLTIGYLICGVLLSIGAAVLPAWRAGQLRPLEAIHEE